MPEGDAPTARRRRLVDAIVDNRADPDGGPTRFEGAGHAVEYDDQRLRLEVDDSSRAVLDDLLADYRVVKVDQPATRRADDGVVYLSAVTDAKHAADFVDALFLEVFDAEEDYELRIR